MGGWLLSALAWIVGFVLLEVAGEALLAVLSPAMGPLRRLFRPPHGLFVLLATWLAALWGTLVGFHLVERWQGALLSVACIPLALLATFLHRAERRAAKADP